MWRAYLGLLLGVFACSTSVVWIKASATHPIVLCAMRLTLGALLLAPLAWRDARRIRVRAAASGTGTAFTAAHLRRAVGPAAVLAVHFISWTYGARMTLAAPATLIVNLVPVALPFFLHSLVGETIVRREILGTVLAITGVLVLSVPDLLHAGGDLWGNTICFGSMLLFAWYLALGRRNRDFPTLWLYVVPVYGIAAVICLVAAAPWLPSFAFGSGREWSLMLALAVMPTIIGHSLLNAAMRHLRGQIVSLANSGQFVFAGILAWLWFGEAPEPVFYAASALVMAGVAVVVGALSSPPPRMR